MNTNQSPKKPTQNVVDKKESSIKAFIIHNLKRARKQKPFTLLVLFGVILSFAALGIGNYVSSSISTDIVVTVGKQQLPVTLLEREIERFVNYAREKDENFSEEELRSEKVVRLRLLEMIQAQLLSQFIRDQHLIPSDAKLASIIANQPEFQVNGAFSEERYFAGIRQSRVSIDDFEENFRMTVARDNILPMILQTSFLPEGSVKAWQDIIGETREVLPHSIVGEKFSSQIEVSDQEIEDYYQNNLNNYLDPIKVKVKFVEFSPLSLRSTIEPNIEELEQYYENNKLTIFSDNVESRNARHILITTNDESSEDEIAEAQSKINELLQKVRANPDTFASIAEEFSEDPGSKDRGGLYENILPGMMVEEFDQALFKLEEGEISDIVKTSFGFHIIKLEKIISKANQQFEDVIQKVEDLYLEEESAKMYNALVENFKSIIDERLEDAQVINTAADEFELEVVESDWLDINNPKFPFTNPKILSKIFSDEGLAKKVVRINLTKENKVLALVVTDKTEERQLSFAEAKEAINKELIADKTSKLITQELEEKIAILKSGKDELLWEKPIEVNRLEPKLPQSVIGMIFSQPSDTIPGYLDVKINDNKSIIYKITKISKDQDFAEELIQESKELYAQYWQSRLVNGIFASLVEKYPVTINEEVLAKTFNK